MGSVSSSAWQAAERNAAAFMRHAGFPDAKVTGAGADRGIDVTSREARAQVKFHAKPVGRPDIHRFFGASQGLGIEHRLFFSRNGYTTAARNEGTDLGMALFTISENGDVSPVNKKANAIHARYVPPAKPEGDDGVEGCAIAGCALIALFVALTVVLVIIAAVVALIRTGMSYLSGDDEPAPTPTSATASATPGTTPRSAKTGAVPSTRRAAAVSPSVTPPIRVDPSPKKTQAASVQAPARPRIGQTMLTFIPVKAVEFETQKPVMLTVHGRVSQAPEAGPALAGASSLSLPIIAATATISPTPTGHHYDQVTAWWRLTAAECEQVTSYAENPVPAHGGGVYCPVTDTDTSNENKLARTVTLPVAQAQHLADRLNQPPGRWTFSSTYLVAAERGIGSVTDPIVLKR